MSWVPTLPALLPNLRRRKRLRLHQMDFKIYCNCIRKQWLNNYFDCTSFTLITTSKSCPVTTSLWLGCPDHHGQEASVEWPWPQEQRNKRQERGLSGGIYDHAPCHSGWPKYLEWRVFQLRSFLICSYYLSLLVRRGQTMKGPWFGHMRAMSSSDSDATQKPGPHVWTFLFHNSYGGKQIRTNMVTNVLCRNGHHRMKQLKEIALAAIEVSKIELSLRMVVQNWCSNLHVMNV